MPVTYSALHFFVVFLQCFIYIKQYFLNQVPPYNVKA